MKKFIFALLLLPATVVAQDAATKPNQNHETHSRAVDSKKMVAVTADSAAMPGEPVTSISLEWFKAIVPVIQTVVWPAAFVCVMAFFRKPLLELLPQLVTQMTSGKIELPGFTFEVQQVANTNDFKNSVQQKNGEGPKIYGNPDIFVLVCKASSSRMMKSTKAMNTPTGCLVQVSTKEIGHNGELSLAEAVTFVPGINVNIVNIVKDGQKTSNVELVSVS